MRKLYSTLRIANCSLVALAGLGIAVPTFASPMAYTATLVTDVKVGEHLYHDAAVTFAFVGDTNDIASAVDAQGNQIPSTYCTPATGWFYWLTKGTASFSLQSNERTLTGHFASGQVFVALDACNGGIGFGSYTGPNGMEIAYPVAFTLGTAMAVALTSGLSSPAVMSGNAWSCIGYPPTGAGNLIGNGCLAPDPYPLHSDVGDVFVYLPYTAVSSSDGVSLIGNHVGTMNRGTFAIRPVVND